MSETHTAVQNCNYFSAYCHFRSEENNSNKHKQWGKKHCEIWNKIQIIIKNYSIHRSMPLHEIINFLCKIEYNCNGQYQDDTKKEGTEKLLDNVNIDKFQLQKA